jgi:hypothetical protein
MSKLARTTPSQYVNISDHGEEKHSSHPLGEITLDLWNASKSNQRSYSMFRVAMRR